jgi:glycosyltransferase involved in cell wall biosynthesis
MRSFPGRITLSRSQASLGAAWSESKIALQMVRGKYHVSLTLDRPFDPDYVAQIISILESDSLFVHSYIGKTKEYRANPAPYKPSPEMKRTTTPLVSICVYNYQYGRYLSQCLESVKAQTYPNIELCFSDNASTDDSWDIALEFSKHYPKRMSLVRNRENFGAGCNQDNTMFDALGKYMFFLCSDDAMKPDFIERCVTRLEKFPDAAFAMVHRDIIDDKGEVTVEPSFYDQTCLIPGEEQTAVYMMTSVNPSISQCLYRREKFHEKNMIGTHNSRWFGARILDFNLCCDYPMIYINEPLLINRVHAASEGAMLADNLLQCMGEYSLVHQFADKAISQGHHKTAERLNEAVEKIGKLCLRYCARFLLQNDDTTAKQYLRLAESILPNISSDELYRKLSKYWDAAGTAARAEIVEIINNEANLSKRTISYRTPPGSIPC